MTKSNTIQKSNATNHVYEVIQVRINNQDGNTKKLIKNARQYGLSYKHQLIPDSIRDFVKYVI